MIDFQEVNTCESGGHSHFSRQFLLPICSVYAKTPQYLGSKVDPWFESHGFLRNAFEMSSLVPDLSHCASMNPWIRMRLSSGILAQSDLLVLAVNRPHITAPFASDILGLTPKSAWTILQDLTSAGWMTKHTVGRKDYYRPTSTFTKTFSFLKTSEIDQTPLVWIEASMRANWKEPKDCSTKYQNMWLTQQEKSLKPLYLIRDRLALSY